MFTGIVEAQGKIVDIKEEGTNKVFSIKSDITNELKIDQSVSHDGVCLTVMDINNDVYKVTAIAESISRSNLGQWKPDHPVNLERCMMNNGRFDGHIVQGHVDVKGEIKEIEPQDGSWLFTISYPETEHVMVEKGSVTVNGISLTCFNCRDNQFNVAIIPYTYENTNFGVLQPGDPVNIEFDILGKYVQKLMNK